MPFLRRFSPTWTGSFARPKGRTSRYIAILAYTLGNSWSVLLLFRIEHGNSVRNEGLDALLVELVFEFEGARHGLVVKCSVGRDALNIDRDYVSDELEYKKSFSASTI